MVKTSQTYRFLLFNYASHNRLCHHNLGDYVQTIATKKAIEQIAGKSVPFQFWDRDSLSFYGLQGERPPVCCVMQGWFSYSVNFLPSENVSPVYIGAHFNSTVQDFLLRILCIEPDFFKEKDIGCRDLYTQEFCQKFRLSSYFSRCLTLTLERRSFSDNGKKVLLVNFPEAWESYLPLSIQKSSMRINQKDINNKKSWQDLYLEAQNLLNFYKESAALVITTALHCAAPCLAMGIPVVLLAVDVENNNRFSALKGLLPIYGYEDLKAKKIPFLSTQSVDIEDLKQLMLRNLKLSVAKSLGFDYDKEELQLVRKKVESYSLNIF